MSVITTIEEEEILAIDKKLNDSFKENPVSAATLRQWKIFLNDRDKKEYSDKEVLNIIKDDPSPKEYDQKELDNKTRDYNDKHQRSDLVKSVILDNGGELEEYEDVPVVAEFEIEDDSS